MELPDRRRWIYFVMAPDGSRVSLKRTRYTQTHPPKYAVLTLRRGRWREVRQSSRMQGWTGAANALREQVFRDRKPQSVLVMVQEGYV